MLFGGAAGQIFEFEFIYKVGVVFFIVIMVLLEYWLFNIATRLSNQKIRVKPKVILTGIIGLYLISQILFTWAEAACYKKITNNSRIFPLYVTLSASDFLHKYGIVDFEKSRIRLEKSTDNKTSMHYPLNPLNVKEHEKKNILIILVDSWYYKVFDSVCTPNMRSFADSALLFANHYSGSNGTRTAVFSIFYSLPGTLWYDVLSSSTGPVMIDLLKQDNYEFGIFFSASVVNPPFDRTVFCKLNNIDRSIREGEAPVRDRALTNDWLRFTDNYVKNKTDKPFFGFLFYDALHSMIQPKDSRAPFQPAWKFPQYEKLSNDFDDTEFLNMYKNIAFFEDSLVNEVLTDLKEKGLFENTIIIITGDHGQEFNDNKKNYWGHNGNFSRAQLQVPYIMYWKGKGNKTYNQWTSHYDIVPTIMEELLGCSNPYQDYSIGRNLFDTTKLPWLVAGSYDNFAIIDSATITNVYYDGSFEITDQDLNVLEDQRFNSKVYDQIFRQINKFNQ